METDPNFGTDDTLLIVIGVVLFLLQTVTSGKAIKKWFVPSPHKNEIHEAFNKLKDLEEGRLQVTNKIDTRFEGILDRMEKGKIKTKTKYGKSNYARIKNMERNLVRLFEKFDFQYWKDSSEGHE